MKAVQPRYVAIRALPVEKQEGDVLEKTEESREKEVKKQNRGTVVKMGDKCDPWIQAGDVISFYRHAATPVTIDGEELLFVHEDHILASF